MDFAPRPPSKGAVVAGLFFAVGFILILLAVMKIAGDI